MKLKNLFLSFLLLIPCITYSAEVFEVDGIYYQPNEDGTCSVTTAPNNGYHFFTDIEIPPQVSDSYGNLYTVNTIGKYAFQKYTNLNSVILPSSIIKIDDYAFESCKSLQNINLPDNIVYIGKFSFSLCYGLNIFNLPKDLEEVSTYGFFGCDNVKIERIPYKVVKIGSGAFSQCSKIKKIIFEGPISSIEEKAFSGNSLLYVEFIDPQVPNCSFDAFSNTTYETTPLYVPDKALDNFRKTAPWNYFSNIIPLSEMPIYPTGLSFNIEKLEINKGTTFQLEPIFTPENTTYKNIIWESSKKWIATVSENGFVTGEASGTSIISAICGDISATCEVTVVIPAESITLNNTFANLYIGDVLQLTANVYPYDTTDKTVQWTSSDENIARVNEEGLVTALSEGNVIITASCGEVSVTCDLKVSRFTINATISPDIKTNLSQIPDVEVNWSTYDFSFNEEANKYPTLSYGNITIDLSDYCSKSVVTSSVSTPWGSSSSTFYILKISLSKLSLTAPGEYVLNIPDKYVYIEQADIYNDEISEVFTVKGGDDSYLPSNFNATPADGSILTELNEIKIDWNDTSLYEGMVGVSNIAVYVNGENNELINNEKFYVSNDILNLILPSLERKVGNIEIIIKEGTILSKSGKTNKEIKLTYKLVSPATGVLLNIEEAELELNQTLQLEVTVLPENEKHMPILWSTSNTNVATVSDNGLVKAVSLGVTTITATCGEISAECEITVIEDAGIESLFLDSENMIDIYSPTGILIKKNTKLEDLKFWDKGIYILKSKGKSYKVNLK